MHNHLPLNVVEPRVAEARLVHERPRPERPGRVSLRLAVSRLRARRRVATT